MHPAQFFLLFFREFRLLSPEFALGAGDGHTFAGAHADVLTSTRKLEPEGFTAKTRVLDSAKTGGVEIEQMRGVWADLQNRALERAGEVERNRPVDTVA